MIWKFVNFYQVYLLLKSRERREFHPLRLATAFCRLLYWSALPVTLGLHMQRLYCTLSHVSIVYTRFGRVSSTDLAPVFKVVMSSGPKWCLTN